MKLVNEDHKRTTKTRNLKRGKRFLCTNTQWKLDKRWHKSEQEPGYSRAFLKSRVRILPQKDSVKKHGFMFYASDETLDWRFTDSSVSLPKDIFSSKNQWVSFIIYTLSVIINSPFIPQDVWLCWHYSQGSSLDFSKPCLAGMTNCTWWCYSPAEKCFDPVESSRCIGRKEKVILKVEGPCVVSQDCPFWSQNRLPGLIGIKQK